VNIRSTRWRHHVNMVVDAITSNPRHAVSFSVLLVVFCMAVGLSLYAESGARTHLMMTTSEADSVRPVPSHVATDTVDDSGTIQSEVVDGINIVVDESVSVDDGMIRYFDGRPIRPVRVLTMEITGYSPDARSCAPFDDGITASGYSVWTNGMKLLAADKRYSFGTLMSVPGYHGNRPVPVLDRGAAIKGNRLDVLFPTHREARQWGRRTLTVTLWDYVD